MTEKEGRYKSYLLRLWQVESTSGESAQRVMLYCVLTGQTHHFGDLDELIFYLQTQDGQYVLSNSPETVTCQQ